MQQHASAPISQGITSGSSLEPGLNQPTCKKLPSVQLEPICTTHAVPGIPLLLVLPQVASRTQLATVLNPTTNRQHCRDESCRVCPAPGPHGYPLLTSYTNTEKRPRTGVSVVCAELTMDREGGRLASLLVKTCSRIKNSSRHSEHGYGIEARNNYCHQVYLTDSPFAVDPTEVLEQMYKM